MRSSPAFTAADRRLRPPSIFLFVFALLLSHVSVSHAEIADSVRQTAAQNAAMRAAACVSLQAQTGFYWEIGDKDKRDASQNETYLGTGSVAGPPEYPAINRGTAIPIYSAGKWLWGAYAFQKLNGQPAKALRPFLNFTSGYFVAPAVTVVSQCRNSTTVKACQLSMAIRRSGYVGKYGYGPGHFQNMAVDPALNLGSLDAAGLGNEIRMVLGLATTTLSYDSPQIAGGARASVRDYATFLRRMLNGNLLISSQQQYDPICTYTGSTVGKQSCDAIYSPTSDPMIGLDEDWPYSLGHFNENASGDAAYSSPGAAGFYPWITADGKYYGVLAPYKSQVENVTSDLKNIGYAVNCGRAIRQAWINPPQAP